AVGLPIILLAIYFSLGVNAFVLSVSIAIIALIAKGIMAEIYPQALVLIGGTILLLLAAFLFPNTALVKATSGSRFIDVFGSMGEVFSSSLTSLGLTIMVIAGFSRYMHEIGASKKLVEISVKPLGVIKSRYILLGFCFILIQVLALFLTSPAGLSLLLMSTLYPILRSLGCSKAAVAAVIASICVNYGPAEVGTILIAQLTNRDLFEIFVSSQLPVLVVVFPFIGIMHMVMQRYWDNRESVSSDNSGDELLEENISSESKTPMYYAILPVLPLVMLFVFSDLAKGILPEGVSFKVGIIPAILMSFFLAFAIDFIRSMNVKASAQKISFMFEQMGQSFITIVSILICAQVLAQGLIKIGFIDVLFTLLPTNEHTHLLIVLFFSIFVFISSMILGSSTTFNAFASLAAEMASTGGVSVVKTLLSMYYSAGFGRAFSPIAGFIIAVSGLVGLKPYDLIKRNAVQLGAGYVLTLALNYIFIN
ncbi:C4-dicarboxylate transporter DcuC, partial [Citrobacter portucalensis]|uniref:C4-dicarboxylate transporter DcuC n=1 Tax=Citrobacter portucalensis TaxID=1639133 RepID=UPI00226B80C2